MIRRSGSLKAHQRETQQRITEAEAEAGVEVVPLRVEWELLPPRMEWKSIASERVPLKEGGEAL